MRFILLPFHNNALIYIELKKNGMFLVVTWSNVTKCSEYSGLQIFISANISLSGLWEPDKYKNSKYLNKVQEIVVLELNTF